MTQKNRNMLATLKDVALKAGVSIKTVSNVIHGNVPVKEEKRQRVMAAVEELHYQPNLPARFLRKGRVDVIALAIPDLSNSYFSDIGDAVIDAASASSYTVLIDHTRGERTNESLVIHGLRPHLIDGVILSPAALELEDFQTLPVNIPLVLLGERFLDVPDVPYDHIGIDNVAAARVATSHLIEMGRRRIAAIGAHEVPPGEISHLRLRGYTEALAAAHLPFDPQLVVQARSYHRADGEGAACQLLKLEQLPDAIFCFNDLLALGVLRALHEAGLRVPEDVAVVGFDDIEDGRYSIPSLTTIRPDKKRIGELAVAFLLKRIDSTCTDPAERVDVPFQLIIRESTSGRGKVSEF